MSFHELSATTLQGETIDFAQYQGKSVLIVNVASQCGYTPQYADLQALHEQHGDQVAVLAFPSNQFGGQEPGTAEEIAQFCEKNYGVTFPVFAKGDVKGANKQPVFQWLTERSQNGWNSQEPQWNFHKYLVDGDGKLMKEFGSATNPFDEAILHPLGISA